MESIIGTSTTWIPPGNLSLENLGWRTNAEKQKVIYRLDIPTLKEADPGLKLKGDQINAFIGYHCSRSKRKILFVDTLNCATYYTTRNNKNGIKAYNYLRGRDYTDDFEAAIIPVIVYEDAVPKNIQKLDTVTGHWCIGVYIKATKELHYFDPYGPLQAPMKPHIKQIFCSTINTLAPNRKTQIVPNFVMHKGINEHNVQPAHDGETCGYFICHVGVQFIHHGITRLYDPSFVLNPFKTNVVTLIKALLPVESEPFLEIHMLSLR